MGVEGGLRMHRALRSIAISSVVSLGVAATALAAAPVTNGVYLDSPHGIIVGVQGTNSIHAFDVACHGRTWVAQKWIPIARGGSFSYSGPDFLAKGGHRTSTTGTMKASGTFKTSRLIAGQFAAGGCSGRYSATFSYSRG